MPKHNLKFNNSFISSHYNYKPFVIINIIYKYSNSVIVYKRTHSFTSLGHCSAALDYHNDVNDTSSVPISQANAHNTNNSVQKNDITVFTGGKIIND